MSNMSYCRFENTSSDLQDCLDAMEEPDFDTSEFSTYEQDAYDSMFEQCQEFIKRYTEIEEETIDN